MIIPRAIGRLTSGSLALVLALGCSEIIGLATDDPLARASWSEIEITPPLGIALGGRGGPLTLANKVLDPLYAQVLYLKDADGVGFVLISFDLIGMPHDLSDRLRGAVVNELGVNFNLVILNCSHTHSGPYMIRDLMAGVGPPPRVEVDYFKTLTEKVISATRTAAKNVKPVTVENYRGTSRVAINRRGRNNQGKIGLLPNPSGPIDENVWALKLTPEDGSPPAVVFSYACHPVIVYGYAGAAISADFPGVARDRLRERLGAAHVQFVQGTAGNVRPRVVVDVEHNRFRTPTTDDLKQAGRELADDVSSALKNKGQKLVLNLDGAADRPFLPRGALPPRAVYEQMAKEENPFRQAAADYWLKRYDTGEGFAKGDPWPLGLVRLADNQWLCCFAGEPCVEWGPKVRAWLGGRNVVVWGHCQEGRTYLPTEALLAEGGYEVDECNYISANSPARFAPGIEDAVRQSLKKQLAFIGAARPR